MWLRAKKADLADKSLISADVFLPNSDGDFRPNSGGDKNADLNTRNGSAFFLPASCVVGFTCILCGGLYSLKNIS